MFFLLHTLYLRQKGRSVHSAGEPTRSLRSDRMPFANRRREAVALAQFGQPILGRHLRLFRAERFGHGPKECRQLALCHRREVATTRSREITVGLRQPWMKADASIRFASQTWISKTVAEALLTSRRVPNKTESVSESVDKITGDALRLQVFLCQPRIRRLPLENRAPTRSGTASGFWRRPRGRLPALVRMPASTTLLKRRVLERGLCIAIFLPVMH